MPRRPRILLLLCGLALSLAGGELVARAVASQTPDAIRWYDAFAQVKVSQMDEAESIDVVFAGTSMAWQAFVPSVFDETAETSSYNAGLNGGTPEIMERWLPEEVLSRLSPSTVVWGLSSYDFAPHYGDDQREVYDNALATREGTLHAVEQSVASWSVLMRERTVLRSFNDISGAGSDEREAAFARATTQLGADGERLDFSLDLGEQLQRITETRLRSFVIDAADRERIANTVKEMRRQGIDVVLVNLPVPTRFIDAHPRQSDHAFVANAIDDLAAALDVRFLNLADGFADDDFVDFTHLTSDAAKRFSQAAAEAFIDGSDDRGTTVAPSAEELARNDEANCTTEIVIDEYGYEVEILNCEAPAAPDPQIETPEEVPETLAGLGAALTTAFENRDVACAAGDDPVPTLLAIAATVDALVDELREDPEGVERAQFSGALYGEGALSGGGCNDPRHDEETLRATAAISTALDRLTGLGAADARTSSQIWQHRDRLSIALWVRDLRAEGTPPDALVLGNSVTRSGIDPARLSEGTGLVVGNASIAGASTETRRPWTLELLDATKPTDVFLPVTYFDLYGNCRVDGRVTQTELQAEKLATSFAGIVDDTGRSAWDIYLGPPGTPRPISPIADTISLGETEARGRYDVSRLPIPDQLEAAITNDRGAWQHGEICTGRLPFIGEEVEAYQAAGYNVVMFVIPPNPALLDGIDGDIERFEQHAAEYIAAAGSVELLDLSLSLDASLFEDGVHMLASGRDIVTDALADAINNR